MASQTDVDALNTALAEPVPYMHEPVVKPVQLYRGISQNGEKWHDVATVRELTGADEEYLSGLEKKPKITYTEYLNGVLERAVLTIGDLTVAQAPAMVNKLILPDRDLLFVGIIRATYGAEREFRATCGECGTRNDVVVNLDDDFPIKDPDFDPKTTIPVKTRSGTYHLRLPNGEDSLEVQKVGSTDSEINTAMLARCVVFDENGPEDHLQWARNLNVADRKKLINALLDIDFGPSIKGVDAQCAECGADMPIVLNWVSLLLG
jgi:hypothetical protein